MVQVKLEYMYINIGANNSSKHYKQKKNTALYGKLIIAT